MNEPTIVINGVTLTEGQAMAVRVAVCSFRTDMLENGLGDDEPGFAIANGYIANSDAVINLMFLS